MRRSRYVVLVAIIILFTLALHSVSTLLSLLVKDTDLHDIDASKLTTITPGRNSSHPQLIPKIIHQTYINASVPERWRLAQESCLKMHPDYEYKFWTDSDCLAFITEEYAWFLPTFVKYPYNIQRADAIRYFILAHYGGVYIDLDNGCRRRLDPLLQFPAWVHLTKPTGISNDGMGAAPRHPFFLFVIDQLQRYSRSWVLPYITIMSTTGPLFLSIVWKRYNRLHSENSVASIAQVWVLSPDQYFKSDTSFFDLSYGGNSWHSGDAKVLLWMGKHLLATIGVGFALATAMGMCIWWAHKRNLRRTRNSSLVESASSDWQSPPRIGQMRKPQMSP